MQLEGVTKTLAGVTAPRGDNGAGKSRLIKLLGGVHSPNDGTISFDGEEVVFTTTQHSQHAGIAVIYQEFNLVPLLTVAENIFKRFSALQLGISVLNQYAGLVDRPAGKQPNSHAILLMDF